MTAPALNVVLSLLLIISSFPAIASTAPTFGAPVVVSSKACPVKETLVTRTADKRVLSVLRNKGMFVESPVGSNKTATADCRIDFVFTRPLKMPATLQLDLRGAEFKGAQAETSYTLQLGEQRHRTEKMRGEVLDGNPLFRRFQLIDLPRGTSKVRLEMKGSARSLNRKDTAHVSIDSFDLCFIDPAKPDDCGSASPAASASRK